MLIGAIAIMVVLGLLVLAQPTLTGPVASDSMTQGRAATPTLAGVTGAIVVEDAWARAATRSSDGGGATSAVYLTVRNLARDDDWLLGVTSDVAAMTEIHRTTVDDGVMRMRPAGVVDVPAGGTLVLQPGGLHVMLTDLRHDLAAGDRLTVTLDLKRAGPVKVEAEIRAPTHDRSASGATLAPPLPTERHTVSSSWASSLGAPLTPSG